MFRTRAMWEGPKTPAGWIRPGGLPGGTPAPRLFSPEVLTRKKDRSAWLAVISPMQL